jgi:hypothetical protein
MRILPPRTFPPRDKIERRHAPAPAPGRYGYRTYRSCLRWEFGFTCAFCLLHEADLTGHGVEGTGLMGIEHFLPISKAQERANEYSNCFYACRFCNGARSDASATDAKGRKLLNPCDQAWGAHFHLSHDDRLLPRPGDADAAYTEFVYDLNDLRKIEIRRWRRERLEELLKVLREAPTSAQELLDLCSVAPAQQAELLLRMAQRLWKEARQAMRDLRRFVAIPRDAGATCRCRRVDRYLPMYLTDQTIEVVDLVSGS